MIMNTHGLPKRSTFESKQSGLLQMSLNIHRVASSTCILVQEVTRQ
jgi:hypothetical protein